MRKKKAGAPPKRRSKFTCVSCKKRITLTEYKGSRFVVAELSDDEDAMAELRGLGLQELSDPLCERCLLAK